MNLWPIITLRRQACILCTLWISQAGYFLIGKCFLTEYWHQQSLLPAPGHPVQKLCSPLLLPFYFCSSLHMWSRAVLAPSGTPTSLVPLTTSSSVSPASAWGWQLAGRQTVHPSFQWWTFCCGRQMRCQVHRWTMQSWTRCPALSHRWKQDTHSLAQLVA